MFSLFAARISRYRKIGATGAVVRSLVGGTTGFSSKADGISNRLRMAAEEFHPLLIRRYSTAGVATSSMVTAYFSPQSIFQAQTRRPGGSRSFSDSLLGRSPMAPSSPPTTDAGINTEIPTARDVTASGGVWAPTSAKRERLREIMAELASEPKYEGMTLDDLATDEQKLDLYLADGMLFLARLTDSTTATTSTATALESDGHEILKQVLQFSKDRANDLYTSTPDSSSSSGQQITQVQVEEYLNDVTKEIEEQLMALPSDRCLKMLRDFYYGDDSNITGSSPDAAAVDADDDGGVDPMTATIQSYADEASLRFRLLLAKGAAQHLKESWSVLTAVSDQDVDRAAVKGENIENSAKTVSAVKLQAVLAAFLQGTCADRVEALWNLIDRDQDGLIDEVEVDTVCELAIEPVRIALGNLLREALEAHPVRAVPLSEIFNVDQDGGDNGNSGQTTQATTIAAPPPAKPLSWRQRRRERKEVKKLTKMFQNSLKNHFLDEVELPHRLRCSYAWANKRHQGNRLDSVLVDDAGWSGRKRYVELHPKIALAEFREVQSEHLPHLDRVAEEFVRSFRNDLWIQQGKLRNRRVLLRDCTLFLTVVCAIDYAIGIM